MKAGRPCSWRSGDDDLSAAAYSAIPDRGVVFDQRHWKGIVHIDGDNLPILEAQQESLSASWSPYNLDVPVCTTASSRIFYLCSHVSTKC